MSIVEERICSPEFSYLHPYFYSNPFALRCELGVGDESYLDNACRRALEIYHILFPDGADAICFNYWVQDNCDSGPAEEESCEPGENMESSVAWRLERDMKYLRFLLENQFRYRHVTIRNLPTYDEPGDELYDTQRRNRVICYSDGKGFDYETLIREEICWEGHEVSFVSFEHECIFSIYDDRGCDVVFMTRDKLREFYPKLEPYFLDFDREEMEKSFFG